MTWSPDFRDEAANSTSIAGLATMKNTIAITISIPFAIICNNFISNVDTDSPQNGGSNVRSPEVTLV